jgi:hypothetical protein
MRTKITWTESSAPAEGCTAEQTFHIIQAGYDIFNITTFIKEQCAINAAMEDNREIVSVEIEILED